MIQFETHITVDRNKTTIDKFKKDCEDIGLTPLLISLSKDDSDMQLMTSDKYTYPGNLNFMGYLRNIHIKHQVEELRGLGYDILRVKVEINPLTVAADLIDEIKYYESHVRFLVNDETIKELEKWSSLFDFHLSKNKFKNVTNNGWMHLSTLRLSGITYGTFIDKLLHALMQSHVPYDKVEVEACVLDTNTELDNKWLNN